MSEELIIESHRGPYTVSFVENALAKLAVLPTEGCHFIVDAKVAEIYKEALAPLLVTSRILLIDASEEAKTLDRFTGYVETLVHQSVRRGNSLIAIGGGVVQDITAFLASTLLRGVRWELYPTTLLAQADSCIGSKSSINVGSVKNILGTYCPPAQIYIDVGLLQTLEEVDVRSGIGEMIKVHAIAGPGQFDALAINYEKIRNEPEALNDFIRRSLEIKKRIIELDEFDTGPRNVMNYGHSFGHAIEAATNFGVPHGIAVTIGMDMANYIAISMGRMSKEHFERMHPVLVENSKGFHNIKIPRKSFHAAIGKDKKNKGANLNLILPDAEGIPQMVSIEKSAAFMEWCDDYFSKLLPQS